MTLFVIILIFWFAMDQGFHLWMNGYKTFFMEQKIFYRKNKNTAMQTKISLGDHLRQDDDVLPLVNKLFSEECRRSPQSSNKGQLHHANARKLLSLLTQYLHKRPQDFEKIRKWMGPSRFRIAKFRNFLSVLYLSMWSDDAVLENKLVSILSDDLHAHLNQACPERKRSSQASPSSRRSSSKSLLRFNTISELPASTSIRRASSRPSPSSLHQSSRASSQPWILPQIIDKPLQRKLTITQAPSDTLQTGEWWWEQGKPATTTTTRAPSSSTKRASVSSLSRKKADDLFKRYTEELQNLATPKKTPRASSSKRRSSSFPSEQQLAMHM